MANFPGGLSASGQEARRAAIVWLAFAIPLSVFVHACVARSTQIDPHAFPVQRRRDE